MIEAYSFAGLASFVVSFFLLLFSIGDGTGYGAWDVNTAHALYYVWGAIAALVLGLICWATATALEDKNGS